MSLRALIVEDDLQMAGDLSDILEVMGHGSEAVEDMESARKRLAGNAYDYLILDMAIPVSPGKSPDRDIGRMLLAEVRGNPKTAHLPVLVVTGEDRGDQDFILRVQRAGGYDLPHMAYLQKRVLTIDGVIQKIKDLLSGQPGVVPPAPPQKPVSAFSAQIRVVTVYRHRVDVEGVAVWNETESGDLRKALIKLNRRDAFGRYQGVPGNDLAPDRNASNKIGPLIKRFRDNATARLLADRDLECGTEDIVANERRRGYYLREWIKVEVVDAEGPDLEAPTAALSDPKAKPASAAAARFEPTKRQQAILEALSAGGLSQKGLIAKLKSSKATVNRELAVLREAGLYTTGIDNVYALTEAGRAFLRGGKA